MSKWPSPYLCLKHREIATSCHTQSPTSFSSEVWLTYKKVNTFNVYNLMTSEIKIHCEAITTISAINLWIPRGEVGCGVDWETGTDSAMHGMATMNSAGSSTWCPVVTEMERQSRRERICVYTWLIHFAVKQKLAQHCQATILQCGKRDLHF